MSIHEIDMADPDDDDFDATHDCPECGCDLDTGVHAVDCSYAESDATLRDEYGTEIDLSGSER